MPNTEEKRSFSKRINDVYRIEVVDLDSLQKVFTFSGKPKSIMTILLLSTIVLFGLFYLLLAFTPLKRTIPGYGDYHQNAEFLQMKKDITSLEKLIEEQQVYNDGLRILLSNDAEGVVKLSEQKLEKEAQKVEESRHNTIESSTLVANTPPNATKEEVVNLPITKEGTYIDQAKINESKYTNKLDNIYFVTPIAGLVSAGFDLSINHYGTDIVAPKNTPVKSIANGVVISADWTRETGNTISIQHQNNIISHYKHNSSLLKNVGDIVSAGEAIAIIGNTGELTDGPHLHFELWYNGIPVNPENFFTFK